jgi:hypothetical protein
MKNLLVVFVVLALAGLAPALAQSGACSTASLRGTYSVSCTGFMSPAPGAPQVPISLLGVMYEDWAGRITGTAKASLGGVTVDQAVTGTAVINSDCTGSVTYDQKINGQPAGQLNIVFHVLNDGQEVRGLATDAGSTMSCNLRLMSRQVP